MKDRIRTINGELFDAGAVPPGPFQPAEPEKGELADTYLTALTGTPRSLLLPEEWNEVVQIVSDRMSVNKHILVMLEQFRERAHAQIMAEWEAAKRAVIEQQEKIQAHREEIADLGRELNKRNDAKAHAFAVRDAAQEKLRTLSRFSSGNTVAKVNAEVRRAEAEATKRSEEAAFMQAQINQMTLVMLKPLQEKLNDLVAVEAEVRHAATGASYTNSFGLVVPARTPI